MQSSKQFHKLLRCALPRSVHALVRGLNPDQIDCVVALVSHHGNFLSGIRTATICSTVPAINNTNPT